KAQCCLESLGALVSAPARRYGTVRYRLRPSAVREKEYFMLATSWALPPRHEQTWSSRALTPASLSPARKTSTSCWCSWCIFRRLSPYFIVSSRKCRRMRARGGREVAQGPDIHDPDRLRRPKAKDPRRRRRHELPRGGADSDGESAGARAGHY